jgi:hypothetical protein
MPMDSLRARLTAALLITISIVSPRIAAAQSAAVPSHDGVAHDAPPLSLALSNMPWSGPPQAVSEPTRSLRQAAQLQMRSPSEPQPDEQREIVAARSEFDRPLLADVARRIVLDPTTYAPAAIVYSSLHLDWKSSQPMFQAGYVEAHPGYTKSGLAFDVPVDYGEGRRRNRDLALGLLGRSIANNAISAMLERALIARAPRHRKLIRVLGWIERTAFASYFSYVLSEQHFEQWRKNEAMARQIGAR